MTLTACDKEKQASAEVAPFPNRLSTKHNATRALATEKLKATDSEAAPDDSEK